MTSAPSTPSPDQLTLFAGDFPAKTSAKPERVPAWLAADRACSTNCSESFAWWDRATSSWKTSQRSLTEEWTTFSERWPRQGMTRNGRAYRQRLWVPVISETGGGALPTPVAQTGAVGPKGLDGGSGARQMLTDAGFPRAAGSPSNLPTPKAADGLRGRDKARARPDLKGRELATVLRDQVIGRQLLTPCANDWKGRTNWEAAERHGPQRLPDCLPTVSRLAQLPISTRPLSRK